MRDMKSLWERVIKVRDSHSRREREPKRLLLVVGDFIAIINYRGEILAKG